MTLHDHCYEQFQEAVTRHPERVALIDGITFLTYRELAILSSIYAEMLSKRLDLSPGQALVVWLNNSPEFAIAFLAAARLGAIFFPLNINWRVSELSRLLENLSIAGVATRRSLRTPWNALTGQIPSERVLDFDDPAVRSSIETAAGAGHSQKRPARVSPDRPIVYLCSSGTSGTPKILPRSHQNMVAGAAATAEALGIGEGLRFMSVIPFYHGNGLDNSFLLPLFTGGTTVIQHGFDPRRFVAAVNEHRAEVLIGSPAIFDLLLKFRVDAECLSTLRVCASSGGPLACETASEFRERFGIAIRQIYGMSEIGVIAVEPTGGGPPAVPISTVSLRVLDASGRPLPAGEKGEIAVKGAGAEKGYLIESPDTVPFLSDGYYRTGDKGYLDSAGNLTLLGRIRAVINISGTKIDPTEVENALMALPEVKACRVVGESRNRHNMVIKAIIAAKEGAVLRREDVIGHCRSLLAEYKLPRIIEFVEALPVDLTGKGR